MRARRCRYGSLMILVLLLSISSFAFAANRTLLFSDSPEMVRQTGVLYSDRVNGSARIFFHHANDSAAVRYLSVEVYNPGTESVMLLQERKGVGVNSDYLEAGKKAQASYWKTNTRTIILLPGERQWLYRPIQLAAGELANGMADWLTDGPVVVSVAMTDDPNGNRQGLTNLATTDLPLRGTFPEADKVVLPDFQDNGIHEDLLLADGKLEKFIRGWDAQSKRASVNEGNYGVIYRIWLPPMPTSYTVSLSPQGGVFAGVVYVQRKESQNPYPVPSSKLFFGEQTVTDEEKLVRMDAGKSGWLLFSPPGASNLPVIIRFSAGR